MATDNFDPLESWDSAQYEHLLLGEQRGSRIVVRFCDNEDHYGPTMDMPAVRRLFYMIELLAGGDRSLILAAAARVREMEPTLEALSYALGEEDWKRNANQEPDDPMHFLRSAEEAADLRRLEKKVRHIARKWRPARDKRERAKRRRRAMQEAS